MFNIRGSESFVRVDPPTLTTFSFFFFFFFFCCFFREERFHIPLEAGHHRWHADDGPTLNAGLVASRILIISGVPVQYC